MNARTKNSNNFAGASTRLIREGVVAHFNKETLVTALLCVGAIMLTTSQAAAQSTGGGTSIFGQDETMVPNAVRYAVVFLFGIAFLFGAGSVVWGVMAYTRRQECMNWIIGGALCMVVGGVVAGVAYLAGGNALNVNQDLSYIHTVVSTTATKI